MGRFNLFKTVKFIVGQSFGPSEVPEKMGASYFYPLTYADNIFGGNQFLNDFLEVPEVNAILNIRARAMASGRMNVVSKETGKPAAANESLVRILRRPNWFQGQQEYWRQSSLWRDIFGNEYLYFLTPVGMANSFKGMFTLDPAAVKIKYKQDDPYFMTADNEAVSYTYKLGSKEIPLDKASLIHLNDNRVQRSKILEGTSKLKALQPAIANIRAAYEKRNIALRMPIGILTNAATDAMGSGVPMIGDEKDTVQNDLKRHGPVPILTSLALNYESMNIDARKMGLFEETVEDTGRICDAYGVPYKILSSAKAGTLNVGGGELREAKKQMYEEGIIPDSDEKMNALNNYLQTEKRSWQVVTTFDHLPVFSENVKERAISFKQMVEALSKALADRVITIEQYQAELLKFGIK